MNTSTSSSTTQQHLSARPEGAELVAWHTSLDVQAIRLPDGEHLMIAGELMRYDMPPTQVVVDLCRLPLRAAVEQMALLRGTPTPKQLAKIEKLQAYAKANYEKGMDTFVECYDRDEWLRFLARYHDSLTDCKQAMRQLASVYRERYADAAYEGRQ